MVMSDRELHEEIVSLRRDIEACIRDEQMLRDQEISSRFEAAAIITQLRDDLKSAEKKIHNLEAKMI